MQAALSFVLCHVKSKSKSTDPVSSDSKMSHHDDHRSDPSPNRYKEVQLVTFVKQYEVDGSPASGNYFEERVLILTKKYLLVCEYVPSHWSFPINWTRRLERDKQKWEARRNHIDGKLDKSERAALNKQLTADIKQAKEERQREQKSILSEWQKILQVDDENVFQRSHITEAAFAKSTSQAAVYLGFKNSYHAESDSASLFGSASNSGKAVTFLFPSDAVREQWRTALHASLAPLVIAGGDDYSRMKKKYSKERH
jgi:hypothetical protein